MIATRHTLVALIAPTVAALALSAPAYSAGTRAGATRAAKRHTIAHIKRYGIVLRIGGASSTPTAASAPAR